MNISKFNSSSFLTNESGAVTVDWVVLTGALVGLGIAATAVVSAGIEDVSEDTSGTMEDYEISTSFGIDWSPLQWDQHNPGIYDSYATWMTGFSDENLLAHMANMQQYADYPANSGHPYDTYHDEYYIALDEAISRGLVSPS